MVIMISLEPITVKLILEGIGIYQSSLELAKKEFDRLEFDSTTLEKEIQKLERLTKSCKENLDDNWGLDMYVGEETLSIFKSALQLVSKKTEENRSSYLNEHKQVPEILLDEFDKREALIKDKLNLNIFKDIKPRNLLTEVKEGEPKTKTDTTAIGHDLVITEEKEAKDLIERTKERIFIQDAQLLQRTKDLIEEGKDGLYDRPIREAATLIEDRLRHKTGLEKNFIGRDLASKALNKENGCLIISDYPQEQEGIDLIFQGFFKFIRNEKGHNIDEKITRERAIQIIGFADYLLSLIDGAKIRADDKAKNG